MSTKPVEIEVWAQDPLSMPQRVTIAIPNIHLDSGPRDMQFVVHDVDHSAGTIYQPVRFLQDQNAFEWLGPDDVRTHQINAFAIARRTLEMIESAIGRQVHWAFGPQLAIHPHYQQDRNAYYSRDEGALAFFYFDIAFRVGKVFTALSHDVVAHELGHAALDGLKPYYFGFAPPETGAFHEAFGDLCAMFSALTFPEVVERVIEATGGDLRKPNIASLMAEEFGYGIYGPGRYFLRYAGDPISYDEAAGSEIHDFSVLLTATMYQILVEFYEINRRRTDETLSNVEALIEATRHLRRIAFRAINYLPPTAVTFRIYGQTLIAADAQAFPDDEKGYRQVIKQIFVERGIVADTQELVTSPGVELKWNRVREPRELYEFIYRHRDELGIPSNTMVRLSFPTIGFVDQSGITSKGAQPLKETIVEYTYPIEALVIPGFGPIPVYFGGTLVFDEGRELVAHFAIPETPGGEGEYLQGLIQYYNSLRERRQITMLDGKPSLAQGVFTLHRLPHGGAAMRLNVCSRFRSSEMNVTAYPMTQLKAPMG